LLESKDIEDRVFSKELSFQKAFLEKEFSDITFKVEGKEFYCHRIILSKASPYFRNLFTTGIFFPLFEEIAQFFS